MFLTSDKGQLTSQQRTKWPENNGSQTCPDPLFGGSTLIAIIPQKNRRESIPALLSPYILHHSMPDSF